MQEMLGKDSRQKILGKKQKLENRLKEREHHLATLESYPNDTLKGREKMHIQMYLYNIKGN